MSRCRLLFMSAVALALLAIAVPAFAAWVPFTSAIPAPSRVEVRESTPERTVLEFNLAGYDLSEVMVNGEACAVITVPGEPAIMMRGAPQLPMLRRSVAVDDVMPVAVRLLEETSDTVPVARIMPSKGHLDRNTDPATVPWEFGPVYGGSGFWPEAALTSDDPFIVRAYRGVAVEVHPFRYNPATGELRVSRRVVVEVTRGEGLAVNPLLARPAGGDDGAFDVIYRHLFLNFDRLAATLYTPVHEPGRLVILTADAYYNDVLPLYQWKLQMGRPTILRKLSEVGTTSTAIRTYLQGLYASPDGLTYAILVGDVADMPTLYGTAESAPSDPCYGMVTADRYPDFLVSRFSAQNAMQVQTQVSRSIRYERDPDTGSAGAWYVMGTGVASNESGGTGLLDWQRTNLLRTDLMNYGFTTVDQVYDPGASRTTLTANLNAGRSIVNYIGHGSTTAWGTTGYSVSDVHNLANGHKLPFIIDVACDNGKFTSGECFAEAWLRSGTAADPKGAIGIYAASTLASWVPPCDMQSEMVDILVTGVTCTMAGLSECGAMKVLDTWGGYEGTKLVEQYNVFGDASLVLRSRVPTPLAVTHAATVNGSMPSFTVDVPGVAGALAALYDQGALHGFAYTDAAGHAVITMTNPPAAPGSMTLTVTAVNRVPYIVTLPYTLIEGPYLVCVSGVIDDDTLGASDGNGNGLLDSGERIEYGCRIWNMGSDPATATTATLTTTSPWVSIIRGSVAIGDIASGDTAVVNDSLVFSVDPGCPDGEVIGFTLQVGCVSDQWSEDFQFVNHAPVLALESAEVYDAAPGGDGDGIAEPGEDVTLVVRLANGGTGLAQAVGARLASGVVVWADATLDSAGVGAILPGGSGQLSPAFAVHVTGDAPAMGLVPMTLDVAARFGLAWQSAFDFPIGGIVDYVEAGVGSWTHAVVTPSFADQWHRSMYYNHTPGGRWAWKFGNPIEGGYANRADGALVSATFDVGPGSQLGFWHRIEADTCAGSPGFAWDGGVVEVSVNGGAWQAVTPVGGYPYRIRNGAVPGPFAADRPCYSGATGWRQARFDLGTVGSGTAQVRFRFGSDGAVARDGWIIDDIRIVGGALPASGVEGTDPAVFGGQVPAAIYLGAGHPNPFRPATSIEFGLPAASRVDLAVYDVSGRRVATLASGEMPAGVHAVHWDGRDASGGTVAAGVYYCRLTAGGTVLARSLVRMR